MFSRTRLWHSTRLCKRLRHLKVLLSRSRSRSWGCHWHLPLLLLWRRLRGLLRLLRLVADGEISYVISLEDDVLEDLRRGLHFRQVVLLATSLSPEASNVG